MTTVPWLAEYESLTRAGISLLPGRTQLEIIGKDRLTFLNAFCTQDLRSLTPGRGAETFITNDQGKILGHGFVFCYEDKLLFDSTPGQAEALIKHLDKYVIREDVKFKDVTDEKAVFIYAGQYPPPLEVFGPWPKEMLTHLSRVQLPPITVQARRVPFVEFLIWEVVCDRADAANLLAWFTQRGIKEVGPESREAARIENRFPKYGLDISEKNLPQEVDRNAQAINFKKGCYLGQETVARIDAIGHVNRLLRLVQFSGDAVLPPGTELRAGGKVVGEVTSSTWSPKYAAPIGIGYLRREFAAKGTELENGRVL